MRMLLMLLAFVLSFFVGYAISLERYAFAGVFAMQTIILCFLMILPNDKKE
jgi:uncharacterized YccA/Bax inhibitor family protein